MRLLLTSDILIDSSFAGAGLPPAVATRRRAALREVFRTIQQRALVWPADAVLIAGNVFDRRTLTRDGIGFLREAFEALRPIPVLIATGEQDEAHPLSPYYTEAWPANVVVFSEASWLSHEMKTHPITIHGRGHATGSTARSSFAGLDVKEDGRVHLALLGAAAEQALVLREAPAALDLVIAGASVTVESATGIGVQVVQAPSPEPKSFGDYAAGTVLEIEIQTDGDHPVVRRTEMPCARTSYLETSLELSSKLGLAEAFQVVASRLAADRANVLKLHLTGQVGLQWAGQALRLEELLRNRCEYVELIDATELEEDVEGLATQGTSLGAFVSQTRTAQTQAPDDAGRALHRRIRAIGVAAYKGQMLPVPGVENLGP